MQLRTTRAPWTATLCGRGRGFSGAGFVTLKLLSKIRHPELVSSPQFVILNLFQDNGQRWCVMLKQVQHDDLLGADPKPISNGRI